MIFGQILEISIIVSSHHFWSNHSECILGYNLDQLVGILMKLSNHQIPCFKKIVYQGILRVLIWKWIQRDNSVEVRCFILEQLNLKKSNVSWTKKIRQICLQPQAMFNKLIFKEIDLFLTSKTKVQIFLKISVYPMSKRKSYAQSPSSKVLRGFFYTTESEIWVV